MNELPQESSPKVVLYEPRYLLNNAVTHIFDEYGWDVFDISADMFIKGFCSIVDKSALVALGIDGTGKEIIPFLRAIHHLSSMNYHIVVWLSKQDDVLKKLLISLGVSHIFTETTLYEELTYFADTHSFPTRCPEQPKSLLRAKLTNNELTTFLEISKGMSVASIANLRRCSNKTIYSLKRNACTRIGLNTHEWSGLLTTISQIKSITF
jgi:DNA-binding CsgD family transcriptional regulator